MGSWVAISFGALDIRGDERFVGAGEYLVTPTVPSTPHVLQGDGARIWRLLLESPLDDDLLDESDRDLLREMQEAGMVSDDVQHPARTQTVARPWMLSPVHELVYALIHHVAAEHNIDVIFIKGPTLYAQGLRAREHSGDVDCWVRPGSERQLANLMRPWGWMPAFSAFSGTRVLHSLTLRSSPWGCAIDVHSWFPGITADPQTAFGIFNAMCEDRMFAGRLLPTPARTAHAVLAALHGVRPVSGAEASEEETQAAVATLRAGGPSSAGIVTKLGAEYALRRALPRAFPEVDFDVENATVPADWAWRLSRTSARLYWEALRLIPARRRAQTIFRVVWPTLGDLRSAAPVDDVPRSALSLRGASLKRLWLKLRDR